MRSGRHQKEGFHMKTSRRGIAVAVLVGGLGVAFAGAGSATTRATAPRNTSPPSISGLAEVGARLTGSHGTWSGSRPLSYAYQWVRCGTQVNNCASIGGATHSSYRLTSADLGHRLLLSVTASNSAGSASATSGATAVVQARSRPVNSAAPSISGSAQVGSALTASPGAWSGTQPITFAYQWRRCDANGDACSSIAGATAATYTLTSADQGLRVRVVVTAKNSVGSTSVSSGPSAVVAPAGPGGQIRLPDGKISIPVTSVGSPERLIASEVKFAPNPVRSRQGQLTVRVRITDTRGFVVRDALVFVRSVPLVTTAAPELPTQADGWATFVVQPKASFPIKRGHAVQFFVRARKAGENVLAGVSGRRLVQVRTA
jgi:hypothetical protein